MEYQRRIARAMDYINRNLGESLSLESVARQAQFSKYHFHRLFRTFVGETVSNFSLRLRLEKSARGLIWDINKNITDIALDNGFSSSQHFATAFRSYFKVTPRSYRKKFLKSEYTTDNYYKTTMGNRLGTDDSTDFTWPDLSRKIPFPHRVEVKQMETLHLAYLREIGTFLRPIRTKLNHIKLTKWANKFSIQQGKLVRVYWDDPDITHLGKYRSDDCIIVPEGTIASQNINVQAISRGDYAVCRVELSRIRDMKDTWRQFWPGWLLESEYQPADKPCFDIFHSFGDLHPKKKWIIDLCIPVEPLS
jgi:AraC family transcriptional regulator